MALSQSEHMALHYLHHCPVYWDGFESNVARLCTSGWKLQADRNLYEYGVDVALTNSTLRIVGFLPEEAMHQNVRQPIQIRKLMPAQHTMVERNDRPEFISFKPDMSERVADYRGFDLQRFRLCDLFDFEEAPELVVEPDDVQTLLDKIVAQQRPKQKELREKSRKELRRTEAKIISLNEYVETG